MSDAALIDGMEWDPGGIEEGTAEAEDAKIALVACQHSVETGIGAPTGTPFSGCTYVYM